MVPTCTVLCVTQCKDLSFSNETLDALWTCLAILCNVTIEDHKRTSFLSYLATNMSADMNASSHSNCTIDEAFLLPMIPRYDVPIKGFLSPIIILLTIINNTLVCIVLLKPHMRSNVNVILVLIALSDILTGLFMLPFAIYFYGMQMAYEWIPHNLCYAKFVLGEYIPAIFHTASIWLTMMLATQRYICVCHPFKAQTWCTMRNVIYGLIAIYIFATLIHAPRFSESYFTKTWQRSRLNPTVIVSACVRNSSPWLAANEKTYWNLYIWSIVIFIRMIPIVSLVVLNTLLIVTMRKAMRRRIELLRMNMKNESQHLKQTNSTTMMLVTVMLLFLLVEGPISIFFIIMLFELNLKISLLSHETINIAAVFFSFFMLLRFPINLFIYYRMCEKFRQTFKRLFKGDKIDAQG